MRRKNENQSKRKLRPEEEILWTRVKRTIKPEVKLEENFADLLNEKPPAPSAIPKNKPTSPPIVTASLYSPPKSKPKIGLSASPIDESTAKKLVKGAVPIDGRMDLHGMTQLQAHRALYSFVQDAHFASKRIVLVITGKGNYGEGILRREVPKWLREPAFTNYVSGFRSSHVTHGGSGALYVRIRKKRT